MFGEKELWPAGVGFDLLAEISYENPEVVLLVYAMRSLDLLQQNAGRQNLAGVLDEGREQVVVQLGQTDLRSVDPDTSGDPVDREGAVFVPS